MDNYNSTTGPGYKYDPLDNEYKRSIKPMHLVLRWLCLLTGFVFLVNSFTLIGNLINQTSVCGQHKGMKMHSTGPLNGRVVTCRKDHYLNGHFYTQASLKALAPYVPNSESVNLNYNNPEGLLGDLTVNKLPINDVVRLQQFEYEREPVVVQRCKQVFQEKDLYFPDSSQKPETFFTHYYAVKSGATVNATLVECQLKCGHTIRPKESVQEIPIGFDATSQIVNGNFRKTELESYKPVKSATYLWDVVLYLIALSIGALSSFIFFAICIHLFVNIERPSTVRGLNLDHWLYFHMALDVCVFLFAVIVLCKAYYNDNVSELSAIPNALALMGGDDVPLDSDRRADRLVCRIPFAATKITKLFFNLNLVELSYVTLRLLFAVLYAARTEFTLGNGIINSINSLRKPMY